MAARHVTLQLDHPLIFIFDRSSPEFELPGEDMKNPAAANEHCIVVFAQHYVDGPVSISLGDFGSFDSIGLKVCEGKLTTPSKEISVFRSDNTEVLSKKLKNVRSDFIVRVDRPFNATEIWLEIE